MSDTEQKSDVSIVHTFEVPAPWRTNGALSAAYVAGYLTGYGEATTEDIVEGGKHKCEVASLELSLQDTSEKLLTALHEVETLQEALQAAEAKVEDSPAGLAELQAQLKSAVHMNNNYAIQIRSLQDDLARLSTSRDIDAKSFSAMKARLQADETKHEVELAEKDEEIGNLTKDLWKRQARIDELEKELLDAKESLTLLEPFRGLDPAIVGKLQAELAEEQNYGKDLKAQLAASEQRALKFATKADELQQDNNTLRSVNRLTSEKLETAWVSVNSRDATISELGNKIAALEAAVVTNKSLLGCALKDHTDQRNNISAAQTEVERLNAEIRKRDEVIAAAEREALALRQELDLRADKLEEKEQAIRDNERHKFLMQNVIEEANNSIVAITRQRNDKDKELRDLDQLNKSQLEFFESSRKTLNAMILQRDKEITDLKEQVYQLTRERNWAEEAKYPTENMRLEQLLGLLREVVAFQDNPAAGGDLFTALADRIREAIKE